MGYSQHRLSHGHLAPDRSLTLPPIQTAHAGDEPLTTGSIVHTAEEKIMTTDFRYKLKVLGQITPPASRTERRCGPLIAIEGDSSEAAAALAEWLKDMLGRDDDLHLTLLDSPDVAVLGSKEQMMAQCHRLAAEWLGKSSTIIESLSVHVEISGDAAMTDSVHTDAQATPKANDTDVHGHAAAKSDSDSNNSVQTHAKIESVSSEKMDIDKRSSTISTTSTASLRGPKPVSIVANYSLHASNRFACAIPIGGQDPYSSNDHWQWAATQWRGIVGPDLTIYVRDAASNETGRPSMEIEAADEKSAMALFVVKRAREDEVMTEGEGKETKMQLEPSVLRRVGFEVSEWVKAFGSRK